MWSLELPVSLLATSAGLAGLSISAYILSRNQTRALGIFTTFNASFFAMTLGFLLRSIESTLRWMSSGASLEIEFQGLFRAMDLVSLLLQGLGAVVMIACLPTFAYSLFGRQPGLLVRRLALACSLVQAVLLAWYLFSDHSLLAGAGMSGLLFLNIAFSLGLMIRHSGTRKTKNLPLAPNQLFPRGVLKRFLWTSVVFFPFFIADVIISQLPANPWIRLVDNCSLPVFFLLLNLGLISLLRHGLDHPPLMDKDGLSDYAKKTYQLTDREVQVLEYVMDGFTLKDLAGVLDISPKTAENHLYGVYQKTGVTNRIQLFQFFQDHRKGT